MNTLQQQGGDFVYQNGTFVRLANVDAMKQRLANLMNKFKNDLWYDPDGIDWWSLVKEKQISERRLRAEISRVLATDPEVLRIVSLTIEHDRTTRKTTIRYSVDSPYGNVGGTL